MATQNLSVSTAAPQFPQKQSPTSTILYGGTVQLAFDAASHKYAVTDPRGTRQVPSVTTILEVIGTSKWPLKQWAANMTTDYIRAAIRPGLRYDEIQLGEILEQARKNFHSISRGAKTIGQLAHEWIEAHLRARLYATPELPLPVNEKARKACAAAAAWIAEHFKPLSMEHRLYSREHEYAGTLDVVGDVDGQVSVVDWKTSKAIYDEMPLQGAAYAQAWAEMYDERVPDRWVIRLDKETGEFEPVKFPRETFRRDLRGFLAARTLHLTVDAMKTPKPRAVVATAAQPKLPSVPAARPLAPVPAQIPATRTAPGPRPVPPIPAQVPARNPQAAAQHDGRQNGNRQITYQRLGDSLMLTGATYLIRRTLSKVFLASAHKIGDTWEWEAPARCFDALSGLCRKTGIRLVPDSGRTA